jgi:diguanylate cyclase (GGDEF)-like protein
MRVLIADDNRDATAILGHLLVCWGFEPIQRYDGISALDCLLESDPPRLALLDWSMPGMDGLDICRAIRGASDRPYTYILLITGNSGRDQIVAGLKAGADDYLIKPYDPEELEARLKAGCRILDLQEQLLSTQRLLADLASRDSLTGLLNRGVILETLVRELSRSGRDGEPLTIAMADLDHFKAVNDTHGHQAGDQILVRTAERLKACLRPYDSIGRYGGEEFLIVLPGCDAATADQLAERLRTCVMVQNEPIPITLSLGIATWDGFSTAAELIRSADVALYEAKAAGRNRVAGNRMVTQIAHP